MSYVGYKHTRETKEKIRKAQLGRVVSDVTREKNHKAHLGKIVTLETREKIRKASLGRKHSLESLERMFGHVVTQQTREKLRKAHSGKVMSLEAREKMRKAHLGKTMSLESREKNRQAHLGKIVSLEARTKMSKARLKYLETGDSTFKYGDTKPEKLVEAHLKKLGVTYIPQKFIVGSPVDFYLPDSKTIIEVDGCYWHACEKCYPKPRGFCKTYGDVINCHMKDALKDNKWLDRGYKVVRIWEHEVSEKDFSINYI